MLEALWLLFVAIYGVWAIPGFIWLVERIELEWMVRRYGLQGLLDQPPRLSGKTRIALGLALAVIVGVFLDLMRRSV